jgi:SAM-dependent methyltransferase
MSASQVRTVPHRELELGPDGLRGKEFGAVADVGHWEELWRRTPVDYRRARSGHFPRQLRSTFARRVQPPARVLEAGCGPAHFTVAAHARGYDVTGMDWSKETVERLRRELPGVDFQEGDARRAPFSSASFDAVYSPGVCEHFVEGPDDVLRDALRLLRPGGYAFVSTPLLNLLARRRIARSPAGSSESFYQYRFTVDGMADTLRRVGYEDVTARPYGVWATLVDGRPSMQRVPLGRAVGVVDLVPFLDRLAASCVWSARKPMDEARQP